MDIFICSELFVLIKYQNAGKPENFNTKESEEKILKFW